MNIPVSKYSSGLANFIPQLLQEEKDLGNGRKLIKVYFNITNYDSLTEFEVATRKIYVTKGYSGKYCVSFMLQENGELKANDGTVVPIVNKIHRITKEQLNSVLSNSPYFTFDVDVDYHTGKPFEILEYSLIAVKQLLDEKGYNYTSTISNKESFNLYPERDGKKLVEILNEFSSVISDGGHALNKGADGYVSVVNFSNELDFENYSPKSTVEDLVNAAYELPYHERLYLFGQVSDSKIFKIHKQTIGVSSRGIEDAFNKVVSLNIRGMDTSSEGFFMPAGMFTRMLVGPEEVQRPSISLDPLL